MAHTFKSSTTTTRSTTTITKSTTKPITNKIDHGQKHKKVVTSLPASKSLTSQVHNHHHHHHHHHHHNHHHHHHKAPGKALTQPKPKLAMVHASATSKATTTEATIKLGKGLEVKVTTKETAFKGGKVAYILGK